MENVYNADETGLIWKSMPATTMATAAEKEAQGRRESKERVTILVCANVTGSHSITPLVIGKADRQRCFKRTKDPIPMHWKGQKKA